MTTTAHCCACGHEWPVGEAGSRLVYLLCPQCYPLSTSIIVTTDIVTAEGNDTQTPQ